MSKERARRRAEREAEAARLAERRSALRARAARRRALLAPVRALLPGPAAGPAARRRRRRAITVTVLFLAVQAAAWILPLSGAEQFGVLVVSLLVTPVAAAVTFGR
ncbi:hypothetical protein [Actinocorallia longicatena]|uniref:Uncharacterized protein n=1 Tax=Actinocorallia longicatena TaxID=111803 RepID=A0ABP6QIQ0_9ACTN